MCPYDYLRRVVCLRAGCIAICKRALSKELSTPNIAIEFISTDVGEIFYTPYNEQLLLI